MKRTGAELAEDGALCSGTLFKEGAIRKTLKERFFVLRPACLLHYYKSPKDKEAAGVVEMNNYEAVLREDAKDEADDNM